jgi:hypothetical protein
MVVAPRLEDHFVAGLGLSKVGRLAHEPIGFRRPLDDVLQVAGAVPVLDPPAVECGAGDGEVGTSGKGLPGAA